jgi:hypothetical protein
MIALAQAMHLSQSSHLPVVCNRLSGAAYAVAGKLTLLEHEGGKRSVEIS